MPAKGAADWRRTHLPCRQREGRLGEFRHHVAALEEAKITAFPRPRAGGTALRHGVKVSAAADFGQGFARFRFRRHQNMAGANFLFRWAGTDFGIIGCADAFFRHAPGQGAGKIRLLQFLFFGAANACAHCFILIQALASGSGGNSPPCDHLIQQQGVQHLRRRAAQFFGQFLGGISKVGEANLLPIHFGHHGVSGRGGWGGLGLARLGKSNPKQQRQGGAKGGGGGKAARMAHRG